MFDWLPLSRYQARQIKGYGAIALAALAALFILGNVITALVRDRVEVREGSFVIKEGFPFFTDAKEYVGLVKRYPYDPGVRLATHRISAGESLWDVANRARISIDTIVAANPFLKNLVAVEGMEIVVPGSDGVLFAINDIWDVRRMKKILGYRGRVKGNYLPTLFKIISTDQVRLVFIPGEKPVLVNNSLEKLYRLKNIFQSPVSGRFTSLYGDRAHPFLESGGTRYHNGVDILAPFNTPIRPAREGMVFFTGWRGGFGKTVMVQHHDGYSTLYGHLSEIRVKCGDWVTRKDVIGLLGSTGWSTGPHLHFTVMRHGRDLNPLLLIW